MSFWQKFFNPHHLRLMDRGGLYAKWHNWPHHHFAHYSIFLVYLALIVKIFLVFGVTYHIIRPEPVKAVAWNIIVSGAGDATYNGIYSENGVYNGEPAYTNGDKWLYWVYGPDPELQFGWWFLSSFKGGGETWYRSEVVSPGVLPDNLWSTNSLPTTILKVKKISGNQISAESK